MSKSTSENAATLIKGIAGRLIDDFLAFADNPERLDVESIWSFMVAAAGKETAAKTVMALLFEAISDNAIIATSLKQRDDDSDENPVTVEMQTTIVDAACLLVEGTGGVSIEVVESDGYEIVRLP